MKLFVWLSIAFLPTLVGLSAVRWMNGLHGNDPAMLVTNLWVALNSISSIAAGILAMRKSGGAQIVRITFGGFIAVVIFAFNIAFTLFGGCILTLR